MRNGMLVEENSPQQILTKYNTNSLEECFLTACCNQETNKVFYILFNYKYFCTISVCLMK